MAPPLTIPPPAKFLEGRQSGPRDAARLPLVCVTTPKGAGERSGGLHCFEENLLKDVHVGPALIRHLLGPLLDAG